MATPALLFLRPEHFARQEEVLVTLGALAASTFTFSTGVPAVRLSSDMGNTVILPFQGQHVWSAHFGGRDLSWDSMVKEPTTGAPFLNTFGGMLQHCGLLAIGGPGPRDTHALHGEFPNAPMQEAWIEAGSDEQGDYLALGGSYTYAAAFANHYVARPSIHLHAGETLLHVSLEVTNLKRTPMDLFYLAHINFLPVDGGRLVYSAPRDPAHVRARAEIPTHVAPKPGYVELIDSFKSDPLRHETLEGGEIYDPEVVFFIDYTADDDGYAHTLQVHPDGSADYVRHPPAELPRVTRWISRTPDQDAIAIAELGTAEPMGYSAAKEKGMAWVLGPGESYRCAYSFGMLPADVAGAVAKRVDAMRG
jgi:hypothetical protein